MRAAVSLGTLLFATILFQPVGANELQVGFAEVDITPDVKGDRPVWIAGYGHGRRATGVHDPLMARCVVLQSGGERIALVSVDLVGLQYPAVKQIRAQLPEYRYVMVSSTHNHEGPDVIGIWGATPVQRGIDDQYLAMVVSRSVECVRNAEKQMFAAKVEYGTATDESLVGDFREPYVKDGVLRVLRFVRTKDAQLGGILVQWNCHPESLGRNNTLISADFSGYTVEALKKKYNCPIAYFTGAVGGLMSNPEGVVRNAAGELVPDGNFEYAEIYGKMVADLAVKAIGQCEPIKLTPFAVSAKPIAIPIENPIYRAAREIGVLRREARVWTGDAEKLGESENEADVAKNPAIETEVAYVRLGELHIACIPGEIYPELVYDRVQDPVDPGSDYIDAPVEPAVVKSLPGPKWLLFGLANDEIGYIIPKRQWDEKAPFCYGRPKTQYGEINSCGPSIAPIIMNALANRVAEAAK